MRGIGAHLFLGGIAKIFQPSLIYHHYPQIGSYKVFLCVKLFQWLLGGVERDMGLSLAHHHFESCYTRDLGSDAGNTDLGKGVFLASSA